MPSVSADQAVEGPDPEGLKRSHLNTGVLEEFAQNMSENIILSFKSQMETLAPEEDCRLSRFNQNQEMLAGEVTTAVFEVVLGEVFSPIGVDPPEGSAGVKMDAGAPRNRPFVDDMDIESSTELNPGKEIRTSENPHYCHPPLSQPGIPGEGSLDYPDAPPTTPLLPELERSRRSFSRLLKGGLAKVYPPSTPPPTPKDGEGGAASDPQAELAEHPNFTDDPPRDSFQEGSRRGAKMAAFAEALSCNIVDSISREPVADDNDLYLLARQLAGAIVTASLDEAKTLV